MNEREPCVCGATEGMYRTTFCGWKCPSCGRVGPDYDSSGELWDRMMRDIRAGREVETWKDRCKKAQAETIELNKSVFDLGVELEETREALAEMRHQELRLENEAHAKPDRPRKLTAVLRDVPSSETRWPSGDEVSEFVMRYLRTHAGKTITVIREESEETRDWKYISEDDDSGCPLRAEWLEDIREEWTPRKGEVVMARGPTKFFLLGWYHDFSGKGHRVYLTKDEDGICHDLYINDEIRPIEEA